MYISMCMHALMCISIACLWRLKGHGMLLIPQAVVQTCIRIYINYIKMWVAL